MTRLIFDVCVFEKQVVLDRQIIEKNCTYSKTEKLESLTLDDICQQQNGDDFGTIR